MRQIRSAIGAATVDPTLLTAAEHIQYEGYLRREGANAAILERAKNGAPIQIVRETGHSRGHVRRILRGQRSDVFRTCESSLEPYLPWLDAQWAAGLQNGSELWRRLKRQGFRGCLRVVSEWAGRRRRAEKADAGSLRRVPHHWAADDDWSRRAFQVIGCNDRSGRRRRPAALRRAKHHRCFPCDDTEEG